MKILVTGGTGLLGWWVVDTFCTRGYEVVATYHEKQPVTTECGRERWVRIDLEDSKNINEVLIREKPDIIIHCAAYTDVDGCEINREKAFNVNYLATLTIAKLLSKKEELKNVKMIYISTDYVFKGDRGNYTELDLPYPINYYGITKLLGELSIQHLLKDNQYCIVRVSGLYGYSPTGKKNFGIIALEKLLKGEEVKAFYDQYLSPTYVKYLSQALYKVVEKDFSGILHIAGERMSRYEFALRLAEVLKVSKDLVKPISMEDVKLVARRPRDSSLNTEKARMLGVAIPSVEECVRDFVNVYKRFHKS